MNHGLAWDWPGSATALLTFRAGRSQSCRVCLQHKGQWVRKEMIIWKKINGICPAEHITTLQLLPH